MSIDSSIWKELNKEVFMNLFACDFIEKTTIEDIHPEARKIFEAYSERFILPEEYQPNNFDNIFHMKNNILEVFAATQIKHYEKTSEQLVYLVDSYAGAPVGRGEIRYNPISAKEFFHQKPFVGYTFTTEQLQGNGYGSTRLRVMNAFSTALFGYPLYSDETITDEATLVWKQLVRRGEAEKTKGTRTRYRFIPKQ